MSFIRGDDIKAAVNAGAPKSEPWREVIARLQARGVTEARMPEPETPVEPWLEELRGWILKATD